MDLESKAFKIALKEIPKEYKIDEKKVFMTSRAVQNKVPTGKKIPTTKNKNKKNLDKDKKQKKNINKKYNKKK